MRKTVTLVRKEILDILRDRKTLIMMIVVPVLLYPLLIIGMTLAMSMFMESSEEKIYSVGISSADYELAENLERIYQKEHEEDDLDIVFVYAQPGEEKEMRDSTDVWMELSERESEPSDTKEQEQMHIRIYYASTNQRAASVCRELEELLDVYQEELTVKSLRQAGISPSILKPLTYESEDTASLSESLGMDIGGSIGMLLITTILLGAVYPAIDATAGEKERGTLETMLTLPVTNFQLIAGKYISVALFACVTAVISILSLGGSVLFLIYGIAGESAEGMQLFDMGGMLKSLPLLVAAMITTALLISALCMCFCVFARSFKEANNYVTPLLLVVMFASMVGIIPSVEFDYRTAMIPIVNVSLMVKQMIAQQVEPGLAGITIAVNLCCSILIVWILARIYNSEDILFGDGFKNVRLFRPRSEIRKGSIPAPGDMLIGVVILFLLVMYFGSAASVKFGFWGTAVNQLLILAVPLLITWYMKSDVKKLFALRRPVWKKFPGVFLLYVGAWCTGIGISSVLTEVLPESTQSLEAAFDPIMKQPIWILILVIAVMPAVCEEIMFRGFLFGSLRGKVKAHWAVLVSAIIFGAFHMSLVKLIPTVLLGMALAAAMLSCRSIYISMVLHFMNNAWSVLIMKFPEQIGNYLPFLTEETMPVQATIGMIAAGVICAAAGLCLIHQRRHDGK